MCENVFDLRPAQQTHTAQTQIWTRTHPHTHPHTHSRAHTRTHTNTHMHTHVHTHTHTHTSAGVCLVDHVDVAAD